MHKCTREKSVRVCTWKKRNSSIISCGLSNLNKKYVSKKKFSTPSPALIYIVCFFYVQTVTTSKYTTITKKSAASCMLVRVQSKCCFQMLLSKLGDKFFNVFVSCNKSGEVSKICRSTCVCIQYCILKCVAKLIISKHLFSFFRYNEGNNSIKYKNTNLLFFKH